MEPTQTNSGLPALSRFDINSWEEVVQTLEKHGFTLNYQGHASHGPEQMWQITANHQSGNSLLSDTQVLYFAMGLAAANDSGQR